MEVMNKAKLTKLAAQRAHHILYDSWHEWGCWDDLPMDGYTDEEIDFMRSLDPLELLKDTK